MKSFRHCVCYETNALPTAPQRRNVQNSTKNNLCSHTLYNSPQKNAPPPAILTHTSRPSQRVMPEMSASAKIGKYNYTEVRSRVHQRFYHPVHYILNNMAKPSGRRGYPKWDHYFCGLLYYYAHNQSRHSTLSSWLHHQHYRSVVCACICCLMTISSAKQRIIYIVVVIIYIIS